MERLLRSALPLCLFIATIGAQAQQQRYLAVIPGMDSPFAEKMVSDILRSSMPFCGFKVDHGEHTVELLTSDPVDRVALANDLAEQGLSLSALYMNERQGETDRWLAIGGPNGMPSYRDTGDPVADDQRYHQDRQAWMSANGALQYDLTHVKSPVIGDEE